MRMNDLVHNRPAAANGRDHFLKIEMQELHETITVKRWLTTFLEEYAGSEDCSVADDRIVDARARAFVSRVDGEDAGFLRLTDKTRFYQFPVTQLGPIWRVAEGYVNPDRRGRGIYAAMLRYAAARAPLEHIDAYLRQELHGFEFGWTQNARHGLAYAGTYIPPRSAGLNCYDNLECLTWLASMLPHPNMWRFLNWRGLTDDEVRMEFYWLPLAQFMARGADRRIGYGGRMIKVVPDLPAAQFLRELVSSRLERVGTIPAEDGSIRRTGKAGRPKGHPNRGGRPHSTLTSDERREQRNLRDRARYAQRNAS